METVKTVFYEQWKRLAVFGCFYVLSFGLNGVICWLVALFGFLDSFGLNGVICMAFFILTPLHGF